MNVKGFLARKFLSGSSRHGWFSSFSLLAFLSITVSVLAFVVLESVMGGFSADLQRKILGFSSHLTVNVPQEGLPEGILKDLVALPGVEEAVPFLEGEAILIDPEGDAVGIRLKAMDPDRLPHSGPMRIQFEEGEDWDNFGPGPGRLPGILLGSELTQQLGILPALAEEVELLFPFGEVGPTGEIEPNRLALRTVGTFKSGYYEYDSKFGLVGLAEGRSLFGDQGREKVGIYLKDPMQALKIKNEILSSYPEIEVKAWQEDHQRLFRALRLERMGMGLVLAMMVALATFNILSFLVMVVYQRRREVAVLEAMGMTRKAVGGIFYRAGLVLGLVGGLLGLALGWGLCVWLEHARLPLPNTYYLEALPVRLNPWIWVAALGVALGLSLLSSWYPVRLGRKVSVVEALRYE